ncbi:MAG: RecQ family ATP-dependent DNA helicase [Campylobacteraceae bacterium]|nr:RecQ family ATP-dependent DNA helicase [Campylobacteraceae bacterium]
MIAFLDIETSKSSDKIYELGLSVDEFKERHTSVSKICEVFHAKKPKFICGHNFIEHDKTYLSNTGFNQILQTTHIIDTLYLSMLLFPNKKTHKLEKPYKTELNIENDPLGDALQTKELFYLLDAKFSSLPKTLAQIFVNLLYDSEYYKGYFIYKNLSKKEVDIYEFIKDRVECSKDDIIGLEQTTPLELAYVISFLYSDRNASISHILIEKFPFIVWILKKICFNFKSINLEEFALNEFGFNTFKEFEQRDSPLLKLSQREIINSALKDSSLLAILPTGGGKTFTFQLPALIKAKSYNALTVVISPLQALMKNHVDSFKEKNQNFSVQAISGYLSPIERASILNEVQNGTTDILYLAPEALRSNSLFNALKCRIIDRFVIDETHCFSSWGHDFRHDYHYIAVFIKELIDNSKMKDTIPVSCFTATAKPEVLGDIKEYFKEHLNIKFDEFLASAKRENLTYEAIEVKDENEKYNALISEISSLGKIPTIIYLPQNAKGCKELCEKLNDDPRIEHLGLTIEPFYAKIDDEIELGIRTGRNKSEILNDFINNTIDIVIATTAFGMGIDKPDIKAVIHYDVSDSLEAYLQESGRGARSKDINAKCIIIYSKNDFDRTFSKLNSTKIDANEIQAIVKTLKKEKNSTVYISPKTLATNSGIDTEDSKLDYESIIKTALLELERCEILKRGRDRYTIFATSLLEKEKRNMEYIRSVLTPKKELYKGIFNAMILIMQNIIQRSKLEPIEIDDLAEVIGSDRKTIFDSIYTLQNENLIRYENDISAFVTDKIKSEFKEHFELEKEVLEMVLTNPVFDIRDIAQTKTKVVQAKKIVQNFNYLSKIESNIFNAYFYKNIANIQLSDKERFKNLVEQRREICEFILDEMLILLGNEKQKEVEFASISLQNKFKSQISTSLFHHSIVYLHSLLKSFTLRKGRLIYYKAYKLELLEKIKENTPYRKRDHYNKTLAKYYERKIEAVHIQIRFLEKLTNKDDDVSEFVSDYFSMEYDKFKSKQKFDKNIKLPLTKEKLTQILENLSDEQKAVFDDTKSESIMVLAGPGSGKTKTLVHKIASLITKESHKAEYFLMLAHSRVAVSEFKDRLRALIGNEVYRVKIHTFHSFALTLLLQKVSNEDELKSVVKNATIGLRNGELELPLTEMLVLDEYQDISEDSYEFIKAIYENMPSSKKIIAVGDDDQCINNFGDSKADIKLITKFREDFPDNHSTYSLKTNYRSKANLVKFSSRIREIFNSRLKVDDLIPATNKNGKIVLVRSDNYLSNLLNFVDNNEQSIFLARNNNEVLEIYSYLFNNGINAQYLTEKAGFNLKDLIELVYFQNEFEKANFKTAIINLKHKFAKSKNLTLALDVVSKFQNEYDMNESQKYLKKAFSGYLNEIDFDDFEKTNSKTVVSTMHKAKGKEFDTVHIFPDNLDLNDEYDKRLLYVAITRAKEKLFIHSKNPIFLNYKEFYDDVIEYKNSEFKSKEIVKLMGLKSLWLSNPNTKNNIIKQNLMAGDLVEIVPNKHSFYLLKDNFEVGRLSANFANKIKEYEAKGYKLNKTAIVEYVVVWEGEYGLIFYEALCSISLRA